MDDVRVQKSFDLVGMAVSVVCMVHCVLVPIVLIVSPVLTATFLNDEAFHKLLLWGIVPSAMVALFLGCRRHRDTMVFLLGVTGLSLLVFSAVWGHAIVGEAGEKVVTLIGGVLMTCGHARNSRLCHTRNCHVQEVAQTGHRRPAP
jgi:hypothetical protein